MLNQLPQPYAPAIIKLLKGVIYSDDPHWDCLQNNVTPIQEYLAKIGIELHNFESDGFAYIKQPREIEIDNKKVILPRLTVSRQLTQEQTIFGVLLRQELLTFDSGEDTGKLVINIEKIRELLTPYLPKYENDEEKFRKEVDNLVNHAINKLGFLKKITGQEGLYEVCRIIKAKIDVETLEILKPKLEQYAHTPIS